MIDKNTLKNLAVSHIEEMQERFPDDITFSIENSKVFRDDVSVAEDGPTENISFQPTTTTVAVIDMVSKYGKNVAALNFASYKWPGGGFIKGAMAQEEALCHDSTLYNVIGNEKFKKEYEFNRANLNKSLYTNFAIYSPDIVFVNDEDRYKTGVLTCPAPNAAAAEEHCVFFEYNFMTLMDRAEFMVKVAKANGVEVLILGAWGCGVFGQNEEAVATVFKEILSRYKFKEVVFAIPSNDKLKDFELVFNEK